MNICKKLFTLTFACSLLLSGTDRDDSILIRNDDLVVDDYQQPLVRDGSPEYVRRIVVPGAMNGSLVGLYKKDAVLDPFKKTFLLKDLKDDEFIGQSILFTDFPAGKNSFAFLFTASGKTVECVLECRGNDNFCWYTAENGKRVSKEFNFNQVRSRLPGNFIVYADRRGQLRFLFYSRKNPNFQREFHCESPLLRELISTPVSMQGRIKLTAPGAGMGVDDYAIITAKLKKIQNDIPFLVSSEDNFDPVKAGWKLIMADEFNGAKDVDLTKWFIDGKQSNARDYIYLDGKGHAVIKADWDKAHQKIETRRLKSRRSFQYGYFETRIRFTKQPGWWTSFFMSSSIHASPFQGVEFDFFEDYYTRPRKPGDPFRKTLDTTAYAGYPRFYKNMAKVWHYHSEVPGSLDDFHTFGVKWTPFEIIHYVDGKRLPGTLKYSPHKTVIWDAFNHCAVACQTRMILSGEIGMGNPKHGKFPEYYLIDYFRAYEIPKDQLPEVKWTNDKKQNLFIGKGDVLHFEVNAKPGRSGAKIRGAYLFDNGYFIAAKTTPPYSFDIPMTRKFYDTTQFMVPGILKGTPMSPPAFETPFPHIFSIFVQDEKGNIAETPSRKFFILNEKTSQQSSAPYQGKPAGIPGTIHLTHYDEGGQEIGYFWQQRGRDQNFRMNETVYATDKSVENLQSCNWLKFTVDVKKTAVYTASLQYICTLMENHDSWVDMYVDGWFAGRFQLQNHGSYGSPKYLAAIPEVKLTQGRHKILFLFHMAGLAADVTFKVK